MKTLDRDEQIRFMEEAAARHQALMDRLLSEPVIRDVVTEPAVSTHAYSRHDMRLVRCG